MINCKQQIYNSYSDSILIPKLIKLAPNLTIAVFELMKVIPARYTVLKALKSGKLDPNTPVIETSSGTYAYGLAIICAELKIPFTIIGDPIIDLHLQQKLTALGGEVQIISATADDTDIQTMRLKTLRDYLAERPNSFWTAQYDNPDNRTSYANFARFLLDSFNNESFTLIGSVGSGGSTCGTIEVLRQTNPDTKLIGVDTFGSVLFGLNASTRKLRGLGNSLLPKNVIHSYYDQIHWLSADCAYKATRDLHVTTALFRGPTTGAAFHVANWYARNYSDEQVVLISPDAGHRYCDTVYNDHWIAQNNLDLTQNFPAPHEAKTLTDVFGHWSYFNWHQRTYNEVIQHEK